MKCAYCGSGMTNYNNRLGGVNDADRCDACVFNRIIAAASKRKLAQNTDPDKAEHRLQEKGEPVSLGGKSVKPVEELQEKVDVHKI